MCGQRSSVGARGRDRRRAGDYMSCADVRPPRADHSSDVLRPGSYKDPRPIFGGHLAAVGGDPGGLHHRGACSRPDQRSDCAAATAGGTRNEIRLRDAKRKLAWAVNQPRRLFGRPIVWLPMVARAFSGFPIRAHCAKRSVLALCVLAVLASAGISRASELALPWIKQKTATECGRAVLASLAAWH